MLFDEDSEVKCFEKLVFKSYKKNDTEQQINDTENKFLGNLWPNRFTLLSYGMQTHLRIIDNIKKFFSGVQQ